MADLSEKDKRTLLGQNYKEVLEKAEQEGRSRPAAERLWAERIEKLSSNSLSACALMVVGAIMLISNLYAVSGPSNILVTAFAAVLLIAGAGWYIYNRITLSKLRANQPGPTEAMK